MVTKQSAFQILQDRSKLETCYQAQIDAILACDYGGFSNIVEREKPPSSHSRCWGLTAYYPLSLFANLPGCYRCASQIELYNPIYPESSDAHLSIPVHEAMRELVCTGARINLPSPEDEDSSFKFTVAELLEFKRRQLLARFNEDGTPRQIPDFPENP